MSLAEMNSRNGMYWFWRRDCCMFSHPCNTTWIDTGLCCAVEIPWLRNKLRQFSVTQEPAGSSHMAVVNMSPAWPYHNLKLQQEVLPKISFSMRCFPVGKLCNSSKIQKRKSFSPTDRICSALHTVGKPTWTSPGATRRWHAQNLKGCKISHVHSYFHSVLLSSYLLKPFVLLSFLTEIQKESRLIDLSPGQSPPVPTPLVQSTYLREHLLSLFKAYLSNSS